MRAALAAQPVLGFLGMVLFLVLGVVGLHLAIRWIVEDEAREWREAHPAQARLMLGTLAALVVAVALKASEIVDPCSEEALRRVCGSMWEWCWWLNGCAIFS